MTWHLSSVLWAFSASTLNSTENLKMYIRTSAFPRTRKIKDLWKMPSWKRESRIMQLNTNPLANSAVNWLQLGPVPNWREFTCMGSWERNPQMVNSSSLFIKEGGTFWKCQRSLSTLFGIQQCAVAAIAAHRKEFFCQVTFTASVLRPAVGLAMQ